MKTEDIQAKENLQNRIDELNGHRFRHIGSINSLLISDIISSIEHNDIADRIHKKYDGQIKDSEAMFAKLWN